MNPLARIAQFHKQPINKQSKRVVSEAWDAAKFENGGATSKKQKRIERKVQAVGLQIRQDLGKRLWLQRRRKQRP